MLAGLQRPDWGSALRWAPAAGSSSSVGSLKLLAGAGMLYGSGPLPPTNPQCNAEMLLFIFSSGPIMVCKSSEHVSSWPPLPQINFEGCCLLFNLC